MGIIKQMNIKNRISYFYDDMINIKNFDPNLLKLYKKSFKNISIYHIGYITRKDGYKINSVNPLYLLVHEAEVSLKKKEESKYLNIALTDNNSQVLKRYAEVWSGIKDQIEKINGSESGEYGKDSMRTKFCSNDNLPLNKQLKILSLTIIVRSVFEEDGKYCPQIFLD